MPVEILAPAGNADCFKAAVNAGANAIYIGLNEFSARKGAENFCVENLEQFVDFAHVFGVKVYVAINTLVKDNELEDLFNTVSKAYSKGADAFILQDMFLGKLLKETFPGICLHLSTQAGVCNEYGAMLAKEYGFSRVILARETAYEDIKKIAAIIETEAFVQGALCSSFSGHCYMSSFAGGMSGNRGYCKQPCRKKYIYSGKGFASFTGYNLSLSDLCLKDRVNALIEAGVSSFKIEGRMRSPEYVFSAVKVYNDALKGKNDSEYFKYLKRSFNRGNYTEGYFLKDMRGIISSKIQGNIGEFIGNIEKRKGKTLFVGSKEKFAPGDGFKVLRAGYEIGSARFERSEGNMVVLTGDNSLSVGDEVYITKDSAFSDFVLKQKRSVDITANLYFYKDKKAKCELLFKNDVLVVESDDIFVEAENIPLDEKTVVSAFLKVGDYPFNVDVRVCNMDSVFAARSVINEFRRKCYAAVYAKLSGAVNDVKNFVMPDFNRFTSDVKESKISLIISDISSARDCSVDRIIYRANDYASAEELGTVVAFSSKAEKFLYLPPYATGDDLAVFSKALECFDGVYAEGYYGIMLARKLNKKLMCGTGFNIFNGYDAYVASSLSGASDFVYSKELSFSEIKSSAALGYVLCLGNVQVMDLVYCPFSKQCSVCRRGNIYSLKDEGGRIFTVRRYKTNACRFEVYNPYDIVFDVSRVRLRLYDCTLIDSAAVKKLFGCKNADELKTVLPNFTSGNLNRGIK